MKVPAIALGLAISIPLANAYSGDLTHYTPAMGSCGISNTDSDAIVALSHLLMNNGANPNTNPFCNKQISIHNPTTVTDTREGCAFDDIDATISLFNKVAPNGDGRVHGIQWTPIGWTIPGGSGERASPPAQASSPAVQPAPSPAAAAAVLPPVVNVQEKVAVVPTTSAAAAPSLPSSSPADFTASTTACTTAGESICSADGLQIGTCTVELTVQMGPVAPGTKCVGGYMVMANSRLRSRRV